MGESLLMTFSRVLEDKVLPLRGSFLVDSLLSDMP